MKKNVRTESIIENIGLGDYAEYLNDYRTNLINTYGYISANSGQAKEN